MAETPRRKLRSPSRNPWYMLATAGEDGADNTCWWNGYMRHLIGDEAAANLKRADGTPIELPLLSPDEIRQIAMNIPDLPQELPEKISLSGLVFAEAVNFQDFYFPVSVDFSGSRFAGTANFSNSKYEATTFFQNVTFTVAPLFFETTLHEDTDWTDVDWPDKPADKEDAIQYVRRYDRLALIMSTLKQPDNEHQFFRPMRAKEVRDGWGISTGLSRLYGLLFRYGWGLKRALGLWVLHILLGAGYLRVMALWQMSQPLPNLTALAISFSNSLPFLGLHRGPVENAYNSFHTLTGFNICWTIQSVSGPLLLFFLLLTIRNRFRLR